MEHHRLLGMTMDPRFQAYDNAYQQVRAAAEHVPPGFSAPVSGKPEDLPASVKAYTQAQQALRVQEENCQPEFGQAAEANRQAVTDSLEALGTAIADQVRIEREVAAAARARNPAFPMPTAEEIAQMQAAEAVTDAARDATEVAEQTYKAGVTAAQLEAVVS